MLRIGEIEERTAVDRSTRLTKRVRDSTFRDELPNQSYEQTQLAKRLLTLFWILLLPVGFSDVLVWNVVSHPKKKADWEVSNVASIIPGAKRRSIYVCMYVCVRGGPNQPLHRDLQWSMWGEVTRGWRNPQNEQLRSMYCRKTHEKWMQNLSRRTWE
jgi:hypothetical protein